MKHIKTQLQLPRDAHYHTCAKSTQWHQQQNKKHKRDQLDGVVGYQDVAKQACKLVVNHVLTKSKKCISNTQANDTEINNTN